MLRLKTQILETDFGDGTSAVVQFNADSRYGMDFLMKFPAIDLSKSFSLSPFAFEGDDGRTVAGVSVIQGGHKVPRQFTKDNPNGMPPAVQKKVGTKVKWDFSDVVNFLYDKFDEKKAEVKPVEQQEVVESEDDLPF